MTWEDVDWEALDRLRGHFLSGTAAQGPYWKSASDLASYDFTYGERIGWKWDQVLRELQLRGWRPRSRSVLDWGCGSGVAGRRVVSFFGADSFDALTVADHSPAAVDFAADAASRIFPGIRVAGGTLSYLESGESLGLVVISHVLNELSPEGAATLRSLLGRAADILWVEPGNFATSRALGRWRDELRSQFRLVAPCTHQLDCPIFRPEAERDWCHFFAPPPVEVFANSSWVKFGQRAGVDLRSLPYSFVALERAPAGTRPEAGDAAAGLSRVIGRPEHFKPYARLLNCNADGLSELELPKRADPALFKELERTKAPLVYRWQRDGRKITAGERMQ